MEVESSRCGHSNQILVPTPEEAADLLGAAALPESQRDRVSKIVLYATLRNSAMELDDRFAAALSLQRCEKHDHLMQRLFQLVKASVRYDAAGEPNYSTAERTTGILACLALQGQVCTHPDLFRRVSAWAMHRDMPGSKDRNFRAVLMLGDARTDEALSLLLLQMRGDERVPASLRIEVLHAVAGVDHPIAAEVFLAALASTAADYPGLEDYFKTKAVALEHLGAFRPKSPKLEQALRDWLREMDRENTRRSLRLERMDHDLPRAVRRALEPELRADQGGVLKERVRAARRTVLGFDYNVLPEGSESGLRFAI